MLTICEKADNLTGKFDSIEKKNQNFLIIQIVGSINKEVIRVFGTSDAKRHAKRLLRETITLFTLLKDNRTSPAIVRLSGTEIGIHICLQ